MSKWAIGVTLLGGLFGCHDAPAPGPRPSSPAAASPPHVSLPPSTGSDTNATPPSPPPAPAPIASFPHASPATDPERVCVEVDGNVTVEHDCGCNDALLCVATQSSPGAVSVAVRKDPSRMPMCTDCFPMVPGKCPIPTSATGPTRVRAGTLELHVELRDGKPASRACAASRR